MRMNPGLIQNKEISLPAGPVKPDGLKIPLNRVSGAEATTPELDQAGPVGRTDQPITPLSASDVYVSPATIRWSRSGTPTTRPAWAS